MYTVTQYVPDWFVTPAMIESLGGDSSNQFYGYKQRTAWKKQIVK